MPWFSLSCLAALLSLMAWSVTSAPVAAEEFPSFEKLPAQPELPSALKMLDGTPITTREQWLKQRRPELKALFEHYMYGQAPPAPENLVATVTAEHADFLGGKATLREVTLKFGPPQAPPVHVLFITPNRQGPPAPVFAGWNFSGNHAVVKDARVTITANWVREREGTQGNQATEAERGKDSEKWAVDLLIERGYALATAYYGDIDPDKHDWSDGIHPAYFKPGQTEPGPHEWGSIRAWAWGLSRMVDFLEKRPEIDRQRIFAFGHSRLGKTALLAAAFDERIALAVPHQSGTGGCALSRQNDQETVERINKVFPHWFCDAFNAFGGQEDKLPIDQHLLMALVAPRPIFDSEGEQDKWANFDNSLRSLKAADEAYKFLGAKGLVGEGIVREESPLSGSGVGDLVQYRRDSKHEANRDYWRRTLDFADAYFAGKK